MLVLGVDPGSIATGYGLVEKQGHRMVCIHSGVIGSSKKTPFHERIHHIFQSAVEIMNRYRPAELAIEDVFFAKNVKSALKIGVQCGVKIHEYTPLEIKQSVVGYGRATKEQVHTMVQVILNLKESVTYDTSDALAAAICHLNWAKYDIRK